MKKKKYVWLLLFGGWLGFSLAAFAHLYFYDWQFYAILVPTTFFAVNLESKWTD